MGRGFGFCGLARCPCCHLYSIKKNNIGYIMAFGTGVLIGAAAYELPVDSVRDGGIWATSIGFIAGAAIKNGFIPVSDKPRLGFNDIKD
ncbi:hypothetical protein AKG34_19200 [Peribacillus butanolivorans]|nr:hypothetical protein AKG34_19200 [Peribacillus butanolivorans]